MLLSGTRNYSIAHSIDVPMRVTGNSLSILLYILCSGITWSSIAYDYDVINKKVLWNQRSCVMRHTFNLAGTDEIWSPTSWLPFWAIMFVIFSRMQLCMLKDLSSYTLIRTPHHIHMYRRHVSFGIFYTDMEFFFIAIISVSSCLPGQPFQLHYYYRARTWGFYSVFL